MQKFVPVFLIVFTFVAAGLLQAAPFEARADAPKADAPKADAPKDAGEKAPSPGGSKELSAIWWSDPQVVKALTLTDEQRKKMDELLKTYRSTVPKDNRPAAFHETLVQGNWKNARIESDKLAKRAATSVRMRGELKIDVLSVLSDKQLQRMVDRYPRLIYKRWKRAMGQTSPR
jgi:Spy/CpxP family protein refolding chaperone